MKVTPEIILNLLSRNQSEYEYIIQIAKEAGVQLSTQLIRGHVVERKCMPQHILDIVEMYFDMNNLSHKKKKALEVRIRHMTCYLLHKYTHATLTTIAPIVGLKDHTSVLHGIRRSKMRMSNEINFARDLADMEKLIKATLLQK